MMGVTHRATGLCAGGFVAWGAREVVLPAPAPVGASVVAVAGAVLLTYLAGRAAMWPDLDHPGSTASREFGLISGWIHELVHGVSCALFDLTATEADVRADDFRGHRGVTHSALAAVLIGALAGTAAWFFSYRLPMLALGVVVGVLTGLVATWVAAELFGFVVGTVTALFVWTVAPLQPVMTLAAVTALLVFLVTDEYAGRRVGLIGAVTVFGFIAWTVPAPTIDWTAVGDGTARGVGLGVGLAVATGMLAHSIGDAATKTGVPLLWPLPVRGRRFYPIHIRPDGMRWHTGQSEWQEMQLRWKCWTLLGVAVIGWWPGLWPLLWALIPWPWTVG